MHLFSLFRTIVLVKFNSVAIAQRIHLNVGSCVNLNVLVFLGGDGFGMFATMIG